MRIVRDNLAALGVNEWTTNKRIDVGAPFSGGHSFIRFIFVDSSQWYGTERVYALFDLFAVEIKIIALTWFVLICVGGSFSPDPYRRNEI
jgi:hypothetical protein